VKNTKYPNKRGKGNGDTPWDEEGCVLGRVGPGGQNVLWFFCWKPAEKNKVFVLDEQRRFGLIKQKKKVQLSLECLLGERGWGNAEHFRLGQEKPVGLDTTLGVKSCL